MKIIFMGTPEFAVPCLQILLDEGHEISAVFTQPDKPKGRRQLLTPPPIKELALQHQITVYQPVSLRDGQAAQEIKIMSPDLIVVVAYGKILPPSVLEIPKLGCVNVHASLLPKYRGAGPIQWAVINGEAQTGVTTMFMAQGLDTGDMILRRTTAIGVDETAGELHDRLSLLGAQTLSETMRLFESGNVQRQAQDDSQSNYAPMLNKEMAQLDFSKPALELHNLIRGLNPWPVAYTVYQGKRLKVLQSRIVKEQGGKVGALLDEKRLLIGCGSNEAIELVTVQLEGSRMVSGEEFLRGHRLELGQIISG